MGVQILRQHNLLPNELRVRMERLLESLRKRFGASSFVATWSSPNTVNFEIHEGILRGVKGVVVLHSTHVEVRADTPVMLMGMKGVLTDQITREIDEVLRY